MSNSWVDALFQRPQVLMAATMNLRVGLVAVGS